MVKAPKVEAPPANGFMAALGRELAYAVEDIRHKVVEEGWFGRQVTPSTFPREDPPMAPLAGIHGEPSGPTPSGPDVHGNGGPVARQGLEGQVLGPEGLPPRDGLPPGQGPVLIEVEPAAWESRETLRLGFIEACREVSRSPLPDERGPDRGHDIAPDR